MRETSAPTRRRLTFAIRARLALGFLAWCACMVLPTSWRLWWRLLPYAGFYVHFDRIMWGQGGYDRE